MQTRAQFVLRHAQVVCGEHRLGKPPIQLLTAYCNYACITGRSPVGLKLEEKGMSEELAALLQKIAWETVTGYEMSGVKEKK